MKARRFKQLLCTALGYAEDRSSPSGSHVKLVAEGRPDIRWAFHDKRELSPIEIKRILVRNVGLTLDEAREVIRHG